MFAELRLRNESQCGNMIATRGCGILKPSGALVASTVVRKRDKHLAMRDTVFEKMLVASSRMWLLSVKATEMKSFKPVLR